MRAVRDHGCWLRMAICVAAASGLFTAAAQAQGGGMGRMSSAGEEKWEKKGSSREDTNTGGSSDASVEPYHGQVYCPVSGEKLGLKQPSLPVQTTIGATTPGFVAKLFGKKGTPGAVIYVCCPKCAEAVRQNPEQYYRVVVNDMAALSATVRYANAPPMNPERQNERVIQPAAYSPGTVPPGP